MAAATAELIRALALPRPPDVLGFSLGASVAQVLAANYSGEIGAVVSGAWWRGPYTGAVPPLAAAPAAPAPLPSNRSMPCMQAQLRAAPAAPPEQPPS